MLTVRKNVIDLPAALAALLNVARTGAPGPYSVVWGTTPALVSGTTTISGVPQIQANSLIIGAILTPGGTLGAAYKWVPTATGGGFIVTAISTAGATVATDTSVLMWIALTPTYHAGLTAAPSPGDNRSEADAVLQVTAPTAVDQPSTNALCVNLAAVYFAMINDYPGPSAPVGGAHKAQDTANVSCLALTLPSSSQSDAGLAASIAFLNALQTNFNAHLAQAGVHYVNDTTNTNSTTVASNLATAEALANSLKASINAHIAIAPAGDGIRVIE